MYGLNILVLRGVTTYSWRNSMFLSTRLKLAFSLRVIRRISLLRFCFGENILRRLPFGLRFGLESGMVLRILLLVV